MAFPVAFVALLRRRDVRHAARHCGVSWHLRYAGGAPEYSRPAAAALSRAWPHSRAHRARTGTASRLATRSLNAQTAPSCGLFNEGHEPGRCAIGDDSSERLHPTAGHTHHHHDSREGGPETMHTDTTPKHSATRNGT